MFSCTVCSSVINKDAQYYLFGFMGPDIISIVENHLGCEVDVNGTMCANCFANIMKKMSALARADTVTTHMEISPTIHEEFELKPSLTMNVCVWCRSSLFMRRTHALPEGPERCLIAERISPQDIPVGSLVCYKCWVRARKILQQQNASDSSSSRINLNTCVCCFRSLNQTRRHPIPEGPERNMIITRISPREIPPGGLVCYACWVSARRSVQRDASIDESRQDPVSAQYHRDDVCAICSMSLFRRRTHSLPSGPERDEVAARIFPRELSGHALLCTTCWTQTVENIQVQPVNVQQQQPQSSTMALNQFTHTTSSSSHCFVPCCTQPERLRVPVYLRKRILTSQKVFVTDNARVCNIHKSFYDWEFLDQHDFSNSFTQNEMESMLALSVQEE